MHASHPTSPTLPPGFGGSAWARRGAMLAVAATAILVYLNSLANGFAYDDLHIIVGNPFVGDPGNLGTVWLAPYWPGSSGLSHGLYRPLTSFLFAVQWAVGGGGPFLFHLTSILLHALASVLVLLLLGELTGRGPALMGSLIFAVHPAHVEAVANPVGQAELVAAVCVLSAAVAYVRRPLSEGSSPRLRLLLALAFLGGLLAKEHAIVLPGLLLALDAVQGRIRRNGYLDDALRLGTLLVAVAAVYLALRYAVLGGSLTGEAAIPFLRDPATRSLTALAAWPHYARLLFFPADLSAMYDPATIPPMTSVTAPVLVGAVLLLSVVGLSVFPPAWPGAGLGAAWFAISILPVSNLLIPIGTVLAERTLYLPSIAVAIWTAYAMRWTLARSSHPPWAQRAVLGAVTVATILLGARTVLRNPVWADNETLLAVTLEDHPENFRVQWFTAQQLFEAGDTTGSRPHWERAYRAHGDSGGFLAAYARFLLATGEVGEAGAMAGRALELDPDGAWSLFTMGLVDVAEGRATVAASRAGRLQALGFDGLARNLEDSVAAGRGGPR